MKGLELLRGALRGLKAYEPEPPLGDAALDANENNWGPPPAFLQRVPALAQAAALNRYPDPACGALLEAASSYYGVPRASLLAGNGSDELIALLLTAFGGEGKRCLVASPTFSMYALLAKAAGWEVLDEPLGGAWELTPAFVARARRDKPALVFLGSPNNPSGNLMDAALVDQLLELPLVLVLDEAYAEFAASRRTVEAPRRPNLVVLRTLSKAFALAGLRLGFLSAEPSLVAELNKARLPYNIDVLAQALGAEALGMPGEFRPALDRILADRPRLEAGLRGLRGAEVWESQANFFLFRHPEAEAFHAGLLRQGLRIRRFSGGRLQGCLRIAVGTSAEVDRCLEAFQRWDKR
jgi:histidinol-phosphate aminotransferase